MVDAHARFPVVPAQHSVNINGPEHAVRLGPVVVRAAQSGQDAEPRAPDVLPGLRVAAGRPLRARGGRSAGEHGVRVGFGVRTIAVAGVEPADGARRPAGQHASARRGLAQLLV